MSSDRPGPRRRGMGRLGLAVRALLLLLLGWIPLCSLLPRHGEPGPLARWLLEPFRLPLPDAQLAAIVISRDLVVRSHQAVLLPARLRDYDLTLTVVLTEQEPLDLLLREWQPRDRPARWSALRLTPFLGGAPWFTSRERVPDPAEGGFRVGANAPTDVRITVRQGVASAVVGWQPVPGHGTLLDPQGQIGFIGAGEIKELRILPVAEAPPFGALLSAAGALGLCLLLALRTAAACQGLRRVGEVTLGFLLTQGLGLSLAHRSGWLFLPDWLPLTAGGGCALTALLLALSRGRASARLGRAAVPLFLAVVLVDRGLRALPAADVWRAPAERLAALQYGEREAGRASGALTRQFEDRRSVHRHDPGTRMPTVVFLGGSLTFAEDVRPELAFPMLATGALRRDHGLEVDTVVAAARGASTVQQLSLFKEQLLFLEPRCVVLCASAHDGEPARGMTDAAELLATAAALQQPATPPWWTASPLLALLLGPRPAAANGPPRVAAAELRAALLDLARLGSQLGFRVLVWPEPRPGDAVLAALHPVLREVATSSGWTWIDTGDTVRPDAAGRLDGSGHPLLARALVAPLRTALAPR